MLQVSQRVVLHQDGRTRPLVDRVGLFIVLLVMAVLAIMTYVELW
jgi:hypothetical protein